MLTYSTIVFCNSGGKVKIAGPSVALDSESARFEEAGWALVSRLGVLVASPAPECDMAREWRCVSVAKCRCER
jgi:hypothetical protein